jgi:hypothetical protein
MDIGEMYQVSWQHEYFQDDDAAAFDTLAEAETFAARILDSGKRLISVTGPGLPEEDQ